MGDCTDTTAELVEEMRRIGRLNHWPTYNFAGSLFGVADRLESLEAQIEASEREVGRLKEAAVAAARQLFIDVSTELARNGEPQAIAALECMMPSWGDRMRLALPTPTAEENSSG